MKETIAESLLEQGEVRGLKKTFNETYDRVFDMAVEVGRAEGRAIGKAEALLRLARSKFGDVPLARVSEIQAADEASLDGWIDALVDADTLEEVFGPRRHQ